MKKSTREVINRLKPYVGHEMLRTNPANGDYSYTDGCPLLFTGFKSDGRIIYRHTGPDAINHGNKKYVLPLYFTDYNWITYEKATKPEGNKLNTWRGKKSEEFVLLQEQTIALLWMALLLR